MKSEAGERETQVAVAIDPVCGKELRPTEVFAVVRYEDQRYSFCGDACRHKFELDPARYTVSCIEVE